MSAVDGAGTRAWSTVHRPVTSEKRDWASAEKSTGALFLLLTNIMKLLPGR